MAKGIEKAKEPATILDRLQADWRRFNELDAALADPVNATDPAKITTLARERGSLARLAVPYGRYLDINSRIAEAEAMAEAELDSELREYAQQEIEELRGKQEEAIATLRNLVYDAQVGADRNGARSSKFGPAPVVMKLPSSSVSFSTCIADIVKSRAGSSKPLRSNRPNSVAFAKPRSA